MNEAVKTTSYKGYEIKIYQDDSDINPIKEWDMLGKFICWHKRYDLGNCTDFASPEEVRAYAEKTGSMLFPLFMYEHSGIALSLSNSQYPYNCPWDSGQLGYVLVDKKDALKEFGCKKVSKKLREKIYEIVQEEVDTYNQYLSGDVYGYIIEKNGKQIESCCWGYYGMEDVVEAAQSEVDYDVQQTIKKHCQQVKTWIKNNVPLIYRSALLV